MLKGILKKAVDDGIAEGNKAIEKNQESSTALEQTADTLEAGLTYIKEHDGLDDSFSFTRTKQGNQVYFSLSTSDPSNGAWGIEGLRILPQLRGPAAIMVLGRAGEASPPIQTLTHRYASDSGIAEVFKLVAKKAVLDKQAGVRKTPPPPRFLT